MLIEELLTEVKKWKSQIHKYFYMNGKRALSLGYRIMGDCHFYIRFLKYVCCFNKDHALIL